MIWFDRLGSCIRIPVAARIIRRIASKSDVNLAQYLEALYVPQNEEVIWSTGKSDKLSAFVLHGEGHRCKLLGLKVEAGDVHVR